MVLSGDDACIGLLILTRSLLLSEAEDVDSAVLNESDEK